MYEVLNSWNSVPVCSLIGGFQVVSRHIVDFRWFGGDMTMGNLVRLLKPSSLVIAVLALASCGGGGSSSSGSAANGIGPAGGSVTSTDGTVTIEVPADALAVSTPIAIVPSITSAPQGNIGSVFDFGPIGTTFSKPVTINLKYDPALIPEGVPESSLTLAFVSGLAWVDVPTTADTVNKILSGQITHFSTYGAKIADTNKLPYGTLIGTTPNGVNVYSNGCIDPTIPCAANPYTYPDTRNANNSRGYISGIEWQCVEFVNRYYYQIYGTDVRVGLGDAKDYWGLAEEKGLVQEVNGGSVAPQTGDIVVSLGDGTSKNVGHVAIVNYVSGGYVHLFEQNWHEGKGDLDHVLAMMPGNMVADFSPSYPVNGWLRLRTILPAAPTGANAIAGDGQASISWNAVPGASSYNLYMASVPGVTKSNYSSLAGGSKTAGVTSPYIQSGLIIGTPYYFVVTAVNATGESIESSEVTATPQASGTPVI
jgi:hypothetical protein